MRLLRAHIENFRCLRDISLEFSTDRNRNVTLIQAAHGNGKTTLFTALEWGLHGDAALAETGYPPVSADSVACDYEVPLAPGATRRYRIVRSASRAIRGDVQLFSLLPAGPVPIEDPESLIRTHFPESRRQTLFLNDTRRAAFTEPGTNAVQAAFRAFGLDARVLTRVSDRTNALFLEIVGGRTSDVANSRASITTDFRLAMSEPDGSFSPAHVRLGAGARLALGIALVFSLMDVGGIETFSVIDAPIACLDLESGREALRQAGQRNAQLVLSMSSGEVHGREDLLDRCVGRGYTLTITRDSRTPYATIFVA